MQVRSAIRYGDAMFLERMASFFRNAIDRPWRIKYKLHINVRYTREHFHLLTYLLFNHGKGGAADKGGEDVDFDMRAIAAFAHINPFHNAQIDNADRHLRIGNRPKNGKNIIAAGWHDR